MRKHKRQLASTSSNLINKLKDFSYARNMAKKESWHAHKKYFAPLRKTLETYLARKEVAQVNLAFEVAAMAHKHQKRQSNAPYITHPVAVGQILAKLKLDKETIMAALLHDVLEDTKVSEEELTQAFGAKVTALVDGVSKLDKLKFQSRQEIQAESFRKMLLSMARDIRVIIIKIADRLHNMQTIDFVSPDKRRRIAKETLDIYAPIAHRLGMNQFRAELEDLSFKASYPFRFKCLKNALKKSNRVRKSNIAQIEKKLKQSLKAEQMTIVNARGRQKHLYSIYKKMRENNIPFSEVNDVYAFRIILKEPADCYLALGYIHQTFKPKPGLFKDYIAIPKANGYQSLHTVLFGPQGIPLEVQIRTEKMHENAEFGIAAHWVYKTPQTSIKRARSLTDDWLNSLLDIQATNKGSIEFIENIKTDLFPEEVFIFTPKGEIVELPFQSTPVDFAYAIHTQIGNGCVAARINRHLAPLSTPLKTGDIVEIISNRNSQPNPAWLTFVATGKARSNIRDFLKNQQRDEAANLGKRLLGNALGDLHIKPTSVSKKIWAQFIDECEFEDETDLYVGVGLGHLIPLAAANRIANIMGKVPDETPKTANQLPILGNEGRITFATCCYPIPGDPIVALQVPGSGLAIHHAECAKVYQTEEDYSKILPVCWQTPKSQDFKSALTLETYDRRGSLAQIANQISDLTNIDFVHSQTLAGGYTRLQLVVNVKNRTHLAKIMRRLKNIKAVIKITRDGG